MHYFITNKRVYLTSNNIFLFNRRVKSSTIVTLFFLLQRNKSVLVIDIGNENFVFEHKIHFRAYKRSKLKFDLESVKPAVTCLV